MSSHSDNCATLCEANSGTENSDRSTNGATGLSLIRTLIIRGWLHPGMEISIIGSGYVGTTVAACFADLGHGVVNVDVDGAIVEAINDGDAPIHEE